MADEETVKEPPPVMVAVYAWKYHTTEGKEYQRGDRYEVPEGAVENLAAQGMARRDPPPPDPAPVEEPPPA